MNYLDDLLPVLLGAARIAFKARTSEDGGAREGGGSETTCTYMGSLLN